MIHAINFPNCCRPFLLFCNFRGLEVVTSSQSNYFPFWAAPSSNSRYSAELTGECRPIRNKNEISLYNNQSFYPNADKIITSFVFTWLRHICTIAHEVMEHKFIIFTQTICFRFSVFNSNGFRGIGL